MSARTALAVSAAWLLVALVWSSQAVLGASMQGNTLAFTAALRQALVNTVPWMPVTLGIIALAVRYPVSRSSWRRTLPIHLVAFLVFTWIVNVLVVLGYWIISGNFGGIATLARNGAFWAMIRLHIAALVYLAIAAGTQALVYYRETRARELQLARVEEQLTRARLDALVAQIRPHFLFNTLHTIGHLWRSGRNDEADAMLDHLGDLFQRVQRNTSLTLVPLDEELDMVHAYLAIERARFPDRLRVTIEASDEARACHAPPLLLQPIVENAIRHGISVSSSASTVTVTANVLAGRLLLAVEDDGPGIQPANGSRGTGTGLAATRARLEQMFGTNGQCRVEPRSGGGTRVTMEMPALADV